MNAEIDGVKLTGRERDVLGCVLRLESYKAIGRRLGISGRTAEVHVANLARKIPGEEPAYKRVLAWAMRHTTALVHMELQPA